ncbi:MAG: SGNH/GDSL hydrolase family protein [Planctomycetes bacterium]|nr:SGNH/GDSL hydrolase family protein [Planctomycetota bacterium]
MKRLLVGLAALALFLLAGEGVLSLGFGSSLRTLLRPRSRLDGLDLPQSNARDTALAAARTPGPYRVPEDALVSYTLKLDSALTFSEGKVEMKVTTDALGLRQRPGGEPPAEALRVVVLGDSIAFGFGLGDAETLAAQLEPRLARALGGRPVACFTVAVPSWNATNAWRFLLDHLDHFRPDIVLYLPVDNDLEDGYGVNEAGQRRTDEDVTRALPLLHVRPPIAYLVLRTQALRASGDDPTGRLGPDALYAGLSALSRERYAGLVRTIGHGAQRLARLGAHLALVPYEQSEFHRELAAELRRQGLELPSVALLERLLPDDRLRVDPHPSAETVGAFASWIAHSLFALGWLPSDATAPVDDVPERYTGRRAELPEAAELEAWSQARRVRLTRELEPRIATANLQGMQQLYGGLNLDGTLASEFAALLPAGRELRVRVEPLETRPDLYPLVLRVHVNGRRVGELELGATGLAEGVFALGAEEAAAPFEVRLESPDWAVVTVRGKSWVASARLVELESRP